MNFFVCVKIILGWRLVFIFWKYVVEFFSLWYGRCSLVIFVFSLDVVEVVWVGLIYRVGYGIIMIIVWI